MAKQYTHDYIEKAFYTWYENDRIGSRRLSSLLSKDGEKAPNIALLEGWKKEFGWYERADALDAELSIRLDDQVINKRIKMFEEHARVGEMMITKGKEYFETHEVDDANVASRIISSGVEIQRVSVGQAEAWAKVSKMTDTQLMNELRKLTGKSPATENEFTIDVDAEEIEETGETDDTDQT